ncbi:hypothetical protein EDD29_7180 [Actinocorallia herbida]|uniref:Lysylphosphatidylglycerol synthase-like protein n=1 Tax=Actinocorallia herbida TaxID=58109 RepID=A0A3N1D7G9_9ACTN|nr:lysylphosphatidylglycerol synthase domain-containing protein [Actinocorallia herbida]ROO89483.1 hypothetical protein EDD29_7180 [Actinocorallia herbida]
MMRFLRPVLGLLAVGFLARRIYLDRADLATALSTLSPAAFGTALALVIAGLVAMMLAWRTVLADLGSPLPVPAAARIMFAGQLGKYVPGSVWAMVGMADLARDRGVPPGRTVGSATISLALTLGCALALAAARLPGAFWPVLVLVVCGLHPKVLAWALSVPFRVLRRPVPEHRVSGAGLIEAAGWTAVGWLLWGGAVWVLADAVAPAGTGWSLYPVAVCAYALAWAGGILVVLAPAGLGVLDGALVLGLTPALGGSAALAVAVAVRAALILADVLVAAAGLLVPAQARERKSTELM